MARKWYSKKHYLLISNGGPDSPGDADRRIAQAEAGRMAYEAAVARFGPPTIENASEFIKFQNSHFEASMKAYDKKT